MLKWWRHSSPSPLACIWQKVKSANPHLVLQGPLCFPAPFLNKFQASIPQLPRSPQQILKIPPQISQSPRKSNKQTFTSSSNSPTKNQRRARAHLCLRELLGAYSQIGQQQLEGLRLAQGPADSARSALQSPEFRVRVRKGRRNSRKPLN